MPIVLSTVPHMSMSAWISQLRASLYRIRKLTKYEYRRQRMSSPNSIENRAPFCRFPTDGHMSSQNTWLNQQQQRSLVPVSQEVWWVMDGL